MDNGKDIEEVISELQARVTALESKAENTELEARVAALEIGKRDKSKNVG